ncbi:hypothetical protein FF19_19785 [Klebsiella michiganensis]|nr:hypothetical protein FF19_19785 [Klebsiella michiganensis]
MEPADPGDAPRCWCDVHGVSHTCAHRPGAGTGPHPGLGARGPRGRQPYVPAPQPGIAPSATRGFHRRCRGGRRGAEPTPWLDEDAALSVSQGRQHAREAGRHATLDAGRRLPGSTGFDRRERLVLQPGLCSLAERRKRRQGRSCEGSVHRASAGPCRLLRWSGPAGPRPQPCPCDAAAHEQDQRRRAWGVDRGFPGARVGFHSRQSSLRGSDLHRADRYLAGGRKRRLGQRQGCAGSRAALSGRGLGL